MGDNPNVNRITDASWRYIEARLALDPGDAIYAGSWVNKPGYHGTRWENQARDRIDGTVDYSVRLPADLLGPPDKTAGYDFKFNSASRGDYRAIARRGANVLAAFEVRDPRLFGWREYLGQTDPDKPAEGLDFVYWTKRVPDPTHEWHDHESELRQFVESWDNKACMLSVMAGETLAAYLARGGRLLPGATLPPGFMPQGDNMLMLALDPATGQHWLCDGMTRRPVAAEDIVHIKYLGSTGALSIWTGTPPEAPGSIWQGVGDLMGLPVGGPPIDYAELGAQIAANLPPDAIAPSADQVAEAVADKLADRLRD